MLKPNHYFKIESNKPVLIKLISSAIFFSVSTCLPASEKDKTTSRSKTFGEITIPEEVTPTPMEIPPSMRLDDNNTKLEVHLFESSPLRRILFSQTKFLKVDVDREFIEATRGAHIRALTGSANATSTTEEKDFDFPNLKGKKVLVQIFGSNPRVIECYQFSDKNSIWFINFIGIGGDSGITEYADSFMRKVSFVGKN